MTEKLQQERKLQQEGEIQQEDKMGEERPVSLSDHSDSSGAGSLASLENLSNEIKFKILAQLPLAAQVSLALAVKSFYRPVKELHPDPINPTTMCCKYCTESGAGPESFKSVECTMSPVPSPWNTHLPRELGLHIKRWRGFRSYQYFFGAVRFWANKKLSKGAGTAYVETKSLEDGWELVPGY